MAQGGSRREDNEASGRAAREKPRRRVRLKIVRSSCEATRQCTARLLNAAHPVAKHLSKLFARNVIAQNASLCHNHTQRSHTQGIHPALLENPAIRRPLNACSRVSIMSSERPFRSHCPRSWSSLLVSSRRRRENSRGQHAQLIGQLPAQAYTQHAQIGGVMSLRRRCRDGCRGGGRGTTTSGIDAGSRMRQRESVDVLASADAEALRGLVVGVAVRLEVFAIPGLQLFGLDCWLGDEF